MTALALRNLKGLDETCFERHANQLLGQGLNRESKERKGTQLKELELGLGSGINRVVAMQGVANPNPDASQQPLPPPHVNKRMRPPVPLGPSPSPSALVSNEV
jgi:hypothetical protein